VGPNRTVAPDPEEARVMAARRPAVAQLYEAVRLLAVDQG